MPVPQASAPYDTLATVTQLTRVALADLIQGIQPNNLGVVNVNGLVVTWVSGNQFTALFNGVQIIINGVPYTVSVVTSPTTLNLVQTAGVQNAVNYSLVIPTGDIFADYQAYVLPTVNLAWRKLQKKLADKGHPQLESEAIISSLPIVTNLDPGSQQWINWTNFFDGTQQQSSPTLPSDFISPLRLWERQTFVGTNLTPFTEMHPASDALRSKAKGSYNRYWDWRSDAIYLPGAILNLDLRVRYARALPDISAAAGGFGSTVVPITRCADALAYYTAGIFVVPRGGLTGPDFEAKGDAAVDQITNAFAKLQQRASYSRRAWGARGRRRIRL